LVDEVTKEKAQTTGVVETNGERVTGMVEKPDDPSSTLVATGCYVLPPAILHALHLVQPSARGEYELSDAIDLYATTGASIAAVPLDGWRINLNDTDDIARAEARLQ
jgi:glucose-1-phosphate thymidylyltransferase